MRGARNEDDGTKGMVAGWWRRGWALRDGAGRRLIDLAGHHPRPEHEPGVAEGRELRADLGYEADGLMTWTQAQTG